MVQCSSSVMKKSSICEENRRNSRYLTRSLIKDVEPSIRFQSITKNPSSIMYLGLICSDGRKAPLIRIPKGVKMTSDVYIRILAEKLIPWLKRNFPDGNYLFQQDGAPCHTAKKTQDWLSENVKKFIPKDVWPPSSPDLNPLDYGIWGQLSAKIEDRKYQNLEDFDKSIRMLWCKLPPSLIRKTCAAFRRRICQVIENNGGSFE